MTSKCIMIHAIYFIQYIQKTSKVVPALICLMIYSQSCIPPIVITNVYVNGRQENSLKIFNNELFFKTRIKGFCAVYVDFWFEIGKGDTIVFNPYGLNIKLKGRSYSYAITSPEGKPIKSRQYVQEGEVYNINSYFDSLFLDVNDTIVLELNDFIIVNNIQADVPIIHIIVDSIIRNYSDKLEIMKKGF